MFFFGRRKAREAEIERKERKIHAILKETQKEADKVEKNSKQLKELLLDDQVSYRIFIAMGGRPQK